MMGRIPVLVNTDCCFPFDDKYNIKDICVYIDKNDLDCGKINLVEEIEKYYEVNKYNLLEIQKNNRNIWTKYFSPIGFLKNILSI